MTNKTPFFDFHNAIEFRHFLQFWRSFFLLLLILNGMTLVGRRDMHTFALVTKWIILYSNSCRFKYEDTAKEETKRLTVNSQSAGKFITFSSCSSTINIHDGINHCKSLKKSLVFRAHYQIYQHQSHSLRSVKRRV